MADKRSRSITQLKSTGSDGFIKIRAKGQQLKVPKELDDEAVNVASGAGKLFLRYLDSMLCL